MDRYVVAIATIEQHTNNLLDLGYEDNLHALNGRLEKENSSWSSTRDTGSSSNTATITITIKDFIGIVNKTQHSILSDDVLRHFDEVRNPEGHWAERAKFSRSDITEMSDTEYSLARGDVYKFYGRVIW